MGTATVLPASSPAIDYEAERRAEEATAPETPQQQPERLQWRAKATHDFADHLQVGGPLACRHQEGGWNVVYLGRYGLFGYANTKVLAGPFQGLSEAKDHAALIVTTAKARRAS